MNAHRVSESTSPILNLRTRWRCGQSYTPATLSLGRKPPGTQCIGVWVGPRGGLDIFVYKKNLLPQPGLEPQIIQTIAQSLY